MNRDEILRSVGLMRTSKNGTNLHSKNKEKVANMESEDPQKRFLHLAKKFVLQIPLTIWYKRQQMEMIQFIYKRRVPKPKPGIRIKIESINKAIFNFIS